MQLTKTQKERIISRLCSPLHKVAIIARNVALRAYGDALYDFMLGGSELAITTLYGTEGARKLFGTASWVRTNNSPDASCRVPLLVRGRSNSSFYEQIPLSSPRLALCERLSLSTDHLVVASERKQAEKRKETILRIKEKAEKQAFEIIEEHLKVVGALRDTIMACSTDTKLLELLPEVKPYLPKAACKTLVPVDQVEMAKQAVNEASKLLGAT